MDESERRLRHNIPKFDFFVFLHCAAICQVMLCGVTCYNED